MQMPSAWWLSAVALMGSPIFIFLEASAHHKFPKSIFRVIVEWFSRRAQPIAVSLTIRNGTILIVSMMERGGARTVDLGHALAGV